MPSDDSFANSLDQDQAKQNVGPDLDQKKLTLFLETLTLKKKNQKTPKYFEKIPSMQRIQIG